MKEFYTYAYLREDGTPFYIGKGKGNRINKSYGHFYLPPKERRIYLKTDLTEQEAFKHEMYMIDVLGRKDLGTGILRNRTNGGEGVSGVVRSEEFKNRLRQQQLNLPEERREHLRQLALNMSQEHKDKIAASLRGTVSPKRETYLITYKTGKTETINGLTPFCKERGYSRGNLYNVIAGRRKTHKDIIKVELV